MLMVLPEGRGLAGMGTVWHTWTGKEGPSLERCGGSFCLAGWWGGLVLSRQSHYVDQDVFEVTEILMFLPLQYWN